MKKIIDEKGRLFGKISIIDAVVVAVVVVLCAAIYTRFFAKSETALTKDENFTYQLVIEESRINLYENLRAGDKIYSVEVGTEIGTISDVTYSQALGDVVMADGTIAAVPVEDRYDVYITVDAAGIVSEGRCYAGRILEICVNEKIDIATKYVECTARVWSLN